MSPQPLLPPCQKSQFRQLHPQTNGGSSGLKWLNLRFPNPSTSSSSSTQHLVAMFLAMFTSPSLCRLLISCTWFSPFAFAHTCVLDVRLLRQMCDDARRCKMHQIGVKTARINQQAASLSWGLEQSHSQIAVFFVDC